MTGECLTNPENAVTWDKPRLETCDASDEKQIWTCSRQLIRVNGTILNLNFGSSHPGDVDDVVLSGADEPLSYWSLFGEDLGENICTKQIGMQILK